MKAFDFSPEISMLVKTEVRPSFSVLLSPTNKQSYACFEYLLMIALKIMMDCRLNPALIKNS